MEYSEYVVSDKQVWMHEGRWWKVSERADAYQVEMNRRIEARLNAQLQTLFYADASGRMRWATTIPGFRRRGQFAPKAR